MSYTVNPELLSLARRALLEKSAVVPPQPPGGMDPSAMAQGAVPPVDPTQAAMGAAPPPGVDPAAAGAAPAAQGQMMDPSMLGALPPAQPAPAPAAGAGTGQKLKPEQMMQMLDYRLYNMQQQLTAIMNAMGVQVPPESLVLPPGTTGAPPAETALPGGPMAPPPPAQPAAGGGDPNAAAAAAGGGAGAPMPPDAGGAPKMANWWDVIDQHSAGRIGRPIDRSVSSTVEEPGDLQTKASAAAALCRSLNNYAR